MEEVLFSDELRGRIVDLEYGKLTEEEIKRIYFEETGKELTADIELYHASDYGQKLDIGKNGFDGTIIHFFDEDKGVNQVYSIARGSEMKEEENWRPEDWMYNTFGIFVGQNNGQYRDAQRFEQEITQIINKQTEKSDIDLMKIGLGHSLGGNTKQMQQLINQEFDRVYTINAAQPTVYQLAYTDREFRKELEKNFGLNPWNFSDIYTVDPEALVQFTEQYYKDAGNDIYRLVAEEDMMLAVSQNIRGFITVGHGEPIDTMADFAGIGDILGEIPDKDIQAIQTYMAKYASNYNNEGFDGAVAAMTGIDLKLIDKVMENDGFWDHVKDAPQIISEGIPMLQNMSKKIPELLTHLSVIHKNLDPILSAMVKHGYVNQDQKAAILDAVDGIEKDLQDIVEAINKALEPNLTTIGDVIDIINAYKTIKEKWNSITSHLDTIQMSLSDLMKALANSVEGHSIYNLLEALAADKGKAYKGKDLFMTVTSKGQKVKINLSSAVRIYTAGMAIYDEKEEVLGRLKTDYETSYLQDFENRKAKLLEKITDMEVNYSKYQYLLGSFTYDAYQKYVLTGINVHEDIPPLAENFKAAFEHMFHYYEQEIQQGREAMAKIKKTIEDYFKFDEELAGKIEAG
ncbi:DUF6792 domain-containing protein [Lysinibacillus odysseyi]|uniref:DUF6792 domain-containing protein n=1 Tax=Lysinibacillus odysseyi 34hs-1 = NBRC 100172 TaxID=1220589 RepID=A0A0A3IHH2_9BACI|nr:DUF6792 domain-containing protein [Lysinibacillus odysseyi]KGR82920.1 hypothetical protein CD32_19005 [Lysinibacillus odysseyi 34hs-1 = NBRC 100172]